MKLVKLLFSLAVTLFCSSPIFAQTISSDIDNSIKSEVIAPRSASVFINDNGAIYPVYVPNLSENTKIQEVWSMASSMLGTTSFDLYYNGQKLSLSSTFANYWIMGNFTVYLEVRRR